MAVSYPYSLPAFADLLKISSIVWDIQRNDELSGSGDGRVWQAELAPPLWTGTVTISDMYNAEAKQIAARIRKLHGAQEALFLYDPLSKYPQADPDGTKLGSAAVSVAALGFAASVGMTVSPFRSSGRRRVNFTGRRSPSIAPAALRIRYVLYSSSLRSSGKSSR